jgi:hypothetical protein
MAAVEASLAALAAEGLTASAAEAFIQAYAMEGSAFGDRGFRRGFVDKGFRRRFRDGFFDGGFDAYYAGYNYCGYGYYGYPSYGYCLAY